MIPINRITTGLLAPPQTAEFCIELRLVDPAGAARIYIGDTLVAEVATGTSVATGQLHLLKGALYSITVEFHQIIGTAAMSVVWSSREMVQRPIAAFFLVPHWQPLKGSPLTLEFLESPTKGE